MPDFAENMTPFQKTYVCVGQFMRNFADMEFQLNIAIRSVLKLGMLENSIVCSHISIRQKIYILKSAINLRSTMKADWLKQTAKDLELIVSISEKRNILAHCAFVPKGDGVDFFYVKARGKLDLPDQIWSFNDFDGLYGETVRLTVALTDITEALTKHPATKAAKDVAQVFPAGGEGLSPLAQLLGSLGTGGGLRAGGDGE
jgi:hypothetical protein